MTTAATTLACIALGAAIGALTPRLVHRVAAGSDEALEQPAWTLRATALVPLVGLGALVFAVSAARLGPHRALVPALLLCALLVGITAADLRYRIIPNRLVVPGLVAGYALGVALQPDRYLELLIATLAAGAFLLAAALLTRGGLGMGDVKLVAMLGAFLGKAVSVALLAGMLTSALPSLYLLARHGGAARKMALPLGPFLALGGVLAVWYGHDLLAWYWRQGR